MPLNRNTLMRIRTIDSCLRRRNRRWTLEDLHKACEDALYDYEGIEGISLRTIQRDIELMRSDKLGYCAPIIVRDRKYYEYEDPEYSITNMPLTDKDIAELNRAIDIIKHYQGFSSMGGQEDILARMQDQVQQQGSNRKLIYIDTNERLKGLNFLGELYDHILKKVPIIVEYRSFKGTRSSFHLSPYLLKEYNNRWFLFAYNRKTKNIQTCALDRIISVCMNHEGSFIENTFFDPETFFGEMVGVTRGVTTKKMDIVLKVDAGLAPYVLTKPIHISQKLEKQEDNGDIIISLDVIHNFELERVILGYGDQIEVLSPNLVRNRISEQLLAAGTKYLNVSEK